MNKELVKSLKEEIESLEKPVTFMEVCGTHTMEIGKLGLRNFLGNNIKVISGPGCPVCVTPSSYLDYIYYLALKKNISIITYGDMLRVPGSNREITLERGRAQGADISIVYSAIDSINIAKSNPEKDYVFVAVGFETTIPSTLILIEEIIEKGLNNLFILFLHKRVEPVMREIISDKEMKVNGFLCPGNVAVVLGEEGFKFIEELGSLGVIAGFDDDGIISSFIQLIKNRNKKGLLLNNYKEFVRKDENHLAKKLIEKYFDITTSEWRGIGLIRNSGYKIKDEYSFLDITKKYSEDSVHELDDLKKEKGICRCGEVLKGKITPKECPAFRKSCTPVYPIGPCMVSSEGTCAAYYKYDS